MNVLHISSSHDLSGGAELCLLDLVEHEIKSGVCPFVVTPREGRLTKQLREMGVRCAAIPSLPWRHHPNQNKVYAAIAYAIKRVLNLKSEYRISKMIDSNKIDIVHINTTATNLGHLAARMKNIPLVWHIREFNSPELSWDFYSAKSAFKIINSSNAIIAVSDVVARTYSNGIATDKISIIYDTVRPPSHNRLTPILCNENISICLIGNRVSDKGQLDALKSVAIMPTRYQKLIKLTLYGSDTNEDYGRKLRSFVRCNHLEQIVEIKDFIDNPYEVLQVTDIALNCSKSESFGRTTVEGMLSGCLVIGSDNTCTHDLLSYERGVLYNSAEDLAYSIQWALDNREEARKRAARGKEYAERAFENGNERIITVLEKTIEDNLSGKTSGKDHCS